MQGRKPPQLEACCRNLRKQTQSTGCCRWTTVQTVKQAAAEARLFVNIHDKVYLLKPAIPIDYDYAEWRTIIIIIWDDTHIHIPPHNLFFFFLPAYLLQLSTLICVNQQCCNKGQTKPPAFEEGIYRHFVYKQIFYLSIFGMPNPRLWKRAYRHFVYKIKYSTSIWNVKPSAFKEGIWALCLYKQTFYLNLESLALFSTMQYI